MWPIVKAILPPEMGKEVRLEETVFWPPQGKVPTVGWLVYVYLMGLVRREVRGKEEVEVVGMH
jgi:hypothetical protein